MKRPKGRPKFPPENVRTESIHFRSTWAFREWLASFVETTGDADISSLIERLIKREAKRLKLPPPPPR